MFKAFQPQNDLGLLRALRRWIDSKSNADWFSSYVRLSVSSNEVVIRSPRQQLCVGRGQGFVSNGIHSSVAAATTELAHGYICGGRGAEKLREETVIY